MLFQNGWIFARRLRLEQEGGDWGVKLLRWTFELNFTVGFRNKLLLWAFFLNKDYALSIFFYVKMLWIFVMPFFVLSMEPIWCGFAIYG